jgi:hypothetical protein
MGISDPPASGEADSPRIFENMIYLPKIPFNVIDLDQQSPAAFGFSLPLP